MGTPSQVIWYEKPIKKSLRQLIAGQGFTFKENNVKKILARQGIHVPIEYVDQRGESCGIWILHIPI